MPVGLPWAQPRSKRSKPSTSPQRRAKMVIAMTFKAHVRNGRILLDEPTDLPDGAEVELAPVEGDDLDDDERQQLEEALAASDADFAEGRFVTAEELLAKLRS